MEIQDSLVLGQVLKLIQKGIVMPMPEIKVYSEYLEFVELPNEGKKTKKFQVCSKKHFYPLGEIRFYSNWRQYCFYPYQDTVFNRTCLKDIQDFILEVIRVTRKD